jgi:hypothetical protein
MPVTTPFRRVPNVSKDFMAPHAILKQGFASPSDKENFPANANYFTAVCERKTVTQPRDEIGFRFAEPYSPQGDDFQPVPVSMRIEFAEVCTGPPWTQGDAIELLRRKEKESPFSPSQSNAYVVPMNQPMENAIPYASYEMPLFDEFFMPPTNQTICENDYATTILSILEPTNEIMDLARAFTHLKFCDISIPLPYIRSKIPAFYKNYFLNDKTATHDLHLSGTNNSAIGVLPIHDLVLVAQCLTIRQIITSSSPKPSKKAKRALYVENVPDLNSFGILLRWLYSNDEDELYEILQRSRLEDNNILMGFALNCRFWGVIDFRLIAVIRTLLEEMGCL